MKSVNICLYGYVNEKNLLSLANAFNKHVVGANGELDWTVRVFIHLFLDPNVTMDIRSKKYAAFIKELEDKFSDAYSNVCKVKVECSRRNKAVTQIPDVTKSVQPADMVNMLKSMQGSFSLSENHESDLTFLIHQSVCFKRDFILDDLMIKELSLYLSGRQDMADRIGHVLEKSALRFVKGSHFIFGGWTSLVEWLFSDQANKILKRVVQKQQPYPLEAQLIREMQLRRIKPVVMPFIMGEGTFGLQKTDGMIFYD